MWGPGVIQNRGTLVAAGKELFPSNPIRGPEHLRLLRLSKRILGFPDLSHGAAQYTQ